MAEPLPGWPPVLHEEWAAAYLSLSVTTFRSSVAPVVPPIRLTRARIGWLRADLDKWIAARAGLSNPLVEATPAAGDEWVDALRKRRHAAS